MSVAVWMLPHALQQRPLMILWRQLGNVRVLLLRLADLDLQRLLDHAIGESIEIGCQCALQFQKLRPENVVHKSAAQSGHHRGAALTPVAVGANAITTHQGDEEMPRPLIRQGKAELNRRFFAREHLKPRPDPLPRPLRRHPFALAPRPGEEGLDTTQLGDQLLFGAGSRSPMTGLASRSTGTLIGLMSALAVTVTGASGDGDCPACAPSS